MKTLDDVLHEQIFITYQSGTQSKKDISLVKVKKFLRKCLNKQRRQCYSDYVIKGYKHFKDSPIIELK